MDLSLADAWSLWWSGRQLTGHTLYGAPVLWLGRTGKLLAFLAGTTIVLDVIGSERILAWDARLQDSPLLGTRLVFLLVPILALAAPLDSVRSGDTAGEIAAAVRFVVVLSGLVLFHLAVLGVGRLLARPLFFAGFALDYLAS